MFAIEGWGPQNQGELERAASEEIPLANGHSERTGSGGAGGGRGQVDGVWEKEEQGRDVGRRTPKINFSLCWKCKADPGLGGKVYDLPSGPWPEKKGAIITGENVISTGHQ